MNKLEIGQKALLKAIGNNARRYGKEYIEEWEIKKIGRVYYEVWKDEIEHITTKIHIDSNLEKSDFAGWKAYFSYQDIEDENESKLLIKEFEGSLNHMDNAHSLIPIEVGLKILIRDFVLENMKSNAFIQRNFKLNVKRINRWWYSVYFDKICNHDVEHLIMGNMEFCSACRVKL